jgi:hypothetical protein
MRKQDHATLVKQYTYDLYFPILPVRVYILVRFAWVILFSDDLDSQGGRDVGHILKASFVS